MERYDLIVIGGGPGGYVAAIRGAQLGKRVALIEKDRLGGTCLNRGCIPTKALMHTSEVLREINKAEELGIRVGEVSLDFGLMHQRKKDVVDKLVSGVEGLIKANGIDFYKGVGRMLNEHQVIIDLAVSEDFDSESNYEGAEEGRLTLEGEYIILATGSRPSMPPIPGLDLPDVVTSDHILIGEGLKTDSLIIIGGGVIGVEIASVYNALGTQVTIIEAMDRILPTMDKEISQSLAMVLKKRGIAINTAARVEKIREAQGEEGSGLAVEYVSKDESKIALGKNVLVAIGRKPNMEGVIPEELLFVDKEGSEDSRKNNEGKITIRRGFIETDEKGRTALPNVYAIGDIVLGGIQLAHAASAEAINAVEDIYGGHVSEISAEASGAPSEASGTFGKGPVAKAMSAIPSGIYTDPEIASVGLTEAQAKEMGVDCSIGKSITSSNGKSIIESADRGYVKLIFDEKKVLLGAQIVSKRATDMIGALASLVASEATLDEMSSVVWPHPTFSEVIGEAIEDALGGAIHAAPKKKR